MKKIKYSIDKDGIWIPVKSVGFMDIEEGRCRNSFPDGYQKRISNNIFTRFYFRFYSQLLYSSFCLGVFSPMIIFLIALDYFVLPSIVSMFLGVAILAFQIHFLSELEK